MFESKKETNKAYVQMVIQKERYCLEKLEMQKQNLGFDTNEQVNKLTKQITQRKQKISHFQEVLEKMNNSDSTFDEKFKKLKSLQQLKTLPEGLAIGEKHINDMYYTVIVNQTVNNEIKKEIDEYKKMKEQQKQIPKDAQNNDKKFLEQLFKLINITLNNTENKFGEENSINLMIDHANQSQKVQLKKKLLDYAQKFIKKGIEIKDLLSQVQKIKQLASVKTKQPASVKIDNQNQVNKLTKQNTKNKQKLSNYKQLLDTINNSDHVTLAEKINEEFDSFEQFTQFVEKELPQGVAIIDLQEEDMKHLIIEDRLPQLKSQNQIYAYHAKTIQGIIPETMYIWKRYQIPQKFIIQEQANNSDQKPNQQQIINKAKRSLQALKQSNGIDLMQCIPETDVTFKSCIEKTVRQYTGTGSSLLNKTTSSKDIIIIKSIRYLVHIIIKNYRKSVIGKPILQKKIQKKILYRNISISKDLFQLYKKDQIVMFTNLTSTSSQNLKKFGYSSDKQGIYHVTYKFTLLDYQKQKHNEFFSGLDVSEFSQYSQKQVLICPFQFFKITDIKRGNINQISLEQMEHTQQIKGKAIIQKIQQKAQKKQNELKFEVDINNLKKLLEDKIKQAQYNEKKNKKQIEEIKDKANLILQEKSVQIFDECQKLSDQNFIYKILAGILNMNPNSDIIQGIHETSEQHEKRKEQQNKQMIFKVINITQNNTENTFEEENIINYVIDHANQNQKVQSNNQLQKYAQEIVQKNIKFQVLKSQVRTHSNINNINYVLVLMNEALAKANMVTILKNTIPKSLYRFYLEKLTIFNANNKVYQFYFDKIPHQNQIKQSITNKFNTKYPSQDQYIKIAFSHDENIFAVTIQSSEDYQSIKQIIAQLNQAKLLDSSCDSKFTNLAYCNQMINPRSHKNYYGHKIQPKKHGNLVYYFPNQTLRIGLKVYGVFGDNKWLNMNGDPDEWVAAYTSLTKTTLKNQLQSKKNDNNNSKGKYKKISRKSIHCCASFDELIKHIQPITINDEQIYIGFQCRVCPQQLQYSALNRLYYFVDKSQSKSIRPYGIILKKKQ